MMKFYDGLADITSEVFECRFEILNKYQWLVTVVAQNSEDNLVAKLSLYDEDLINRSMARLSPLAIDLIELAVAVYAVDRTIQPDPKAYCVVRLELPVRCPHTLGSQFTLSKLTELLYWYTGYEWQIDFVQRDASIEARQSEYSQLFDWQPNSCPIDVALWSGGLDCLAGLYNRAIYEPQRRFVLCGTGANFVNYRLQQDIVESLPEDIFNRVKLLRVHYHLEGLSKTLPEMSRMRSRGFTFMLIGAACAYIEGLNVLHVYENGIGAINLRFRDSEIGLNHARSVHPLSLLLMAKWLESLFELPFRIENPFLFFTKAQMCQVFRSEQDLEIAFRTETCDRKHRKQDAKQCGRCSSCILRRHAFAALGVRDKTPYIEESTSWLNSINKKDIVEEGNHIPSVLFQVNALGNHLRADNPWKSLVMQYEALAAEILDRTPSYYGLTELEMQHNLLRLFSQYVNEWDSLKSLFHE
jgi:hypothetical protein